MAILCILASLIGSLVGLALCWVGVTLADLVAFLLGYGEAPPERQPRRRPILRLHPMPPALIDHVYCGSIMADAYPELLPEIAPQALRELLGPPGDDCPVRFDVEGKYHSRF
jgi:hypothetical protein